MAAAPATGIISTSWGEAARRRLAAAGALGILAGAVHYLAAVEHLAEGLAPAAFLAAVGTAQIAAGIRLARRPSDALVFASVAGTLALFALFSVAYSFGLPFGPHANQPEHFGPIVAVSKLTELAFLWTLAPFLSWEGTREAGVTQEARHRQAPPPLGRIATVWAALAGVVLLAVLAFALTLGSAGTVHAASSAQVAPTGLTAAAEIRLFAFGPQRLEVAPGTTVSWINRDLIEHSVTFGTPGTPGSPGTAGPSGSAGIPGVSTTPSSPATPASPAAPLFDSGLLGQGATFSWLFETPGEYAYFCTKHPSMRGTVWVGTLPTLPDPLAAEPLLQTTQSDQERTRSDETAE